MTYQGDDIEIPEILICDGWSVDDVLTVEDCDDAFAYLTGALAHIEARIETESAVQQISPEAMGRLKGALRWKKAALNIVNNKRVALKREAEAKERSQVLQQFVDVVREKSTKEFSVWMDIAIARVQNGQ